MEGLGQLGDNTTSVVLFTIVAGALFVYFVLSKLKSTKLPTAEILKDGDEVSQIINLSHRFKDAGIYVGIKNIFNTIRSRRKIVTGAAHVENVLRDTRLFEKAYKIFQFAHSLFGDGVLTSHGQMHDFQRKVLNPVFSPQQLKKYMPTIQQHAQKLVQLWRNEINDTVEGKRMIVKDWLTNLSLDIISDVGFGYQMNSQDYRADAVMNPFSQALTDHSNNMSKSKLQAVLLFFFVFVPSIRPLLRFLQKFVGNENTFVMETMEKLIAKRKEEIISGKVPESQHKDFLSVLLNAQIKDARMTDKLIGDNIFTFLAAGQGTTRTALTWMLYALGMYPEVQKKLRKEVKGHLGDVADNFTYEQLKGCVYLECFVKESLRYSPPIPFFGRNNTHNSANVLGVKLEKDSTVIIDVNGMHRNEDNYTDPDKFDPERFMPGNTIGSINFLPFGYGIFNCIGRNFAMTSMKTILVLLILNFEFLVDESEEQPVRQVAVELDSKQPIFVRIKKLTNE